MMSKLPLGETIMQNNQTVTWCYGCKQKICSGHWIIPQETERREN